MIRNYLRWTGRRMHWMNLVIVIFALCLVLPVMSDNAGVAGSLSGDRVAILWPRRVGGTSHIDETAVDTAPAVAYDASMRRYLVVWMTARNAGSTESGLDVYGILLDKTGQAIGTEFRISDSTVAARNGLPTVAAGQGEFVVAWAARGAPCRIHVQRVTTDASPQSDLTLTSGTEPYHSPNLVYNPKRQRYVLACVAGEDYMPPTYLGASTADCGNNPASTSRIKAVEFYFTGDHLIADIPRDVSDVGEGAFRPRLAYSAGLDQYLVAWEDRRTAGGQPSLFDVYAQRLGSDMTMVGNNIPLATGGNYTNYDTSATWTPRPAVAAGSDQFLVTWFTREARGSAVIWSVMGGLVPVNGAPAPTFTVARMSFARSHSGRSPTGTLAAVCIDSTQEYMVGIASHRESLWGYLSSARIQRVSSNGQLLRPDGSPQSQAGAGTSLDTENVDQLAIAMAANPDGAISKADYMVVYSRHSRGQPVRDTDIWGTRVQIPCTPPEAVKIPISFNQGWNLFSFNVQPIDCSGPITQVQEILWSIDGYYQAVLGYDQGGNAYYPDVPAQFNTLEVLDYRHGYWLRVSQPRTLEVDGLPISYTQPISLYVGWNLVSYLPDAALPVTVALASIEGSYSAVLGYDGGALSAYLSLPSVMNSLQTLEPNHGYWIKMTRPGILIYPSDGPTATSMYSVHAVNALRSVSDVSPANQWADFYSQHSTVNGLPIPVGAKVVAYDPRGRKAGEFAVKRAGWIGAFPIYGDDSSTPEIDGARPGEMVTFYIDGRLATTNGPDEPIWTSFGDLRNVDLTVTFRGGQVNLPLIFK